MLSLTGYFDASGTHAGSSNVTIAGWLSTSQAWTNFEADWRAALESFGVDMFHMREYAHRLGQFARWSEPQRRIRFGRLAEIVTSDTLASIAVAVPTKEFEEEFTPSARKHAGGPYGFAAAVLFLHAADYVSESLNPPGTPFEIAYVFERGDVGAGQAQNLFEANKADPRQEERLHLLSLRFQDKRQVGALQAADILAYELYQHFPRQLGLEPREPRRYNLRQLAANRAWDWRYMSRERMRDWADVVDISARIAATEGWPRKPLPDDWTWDQATPPNRATKRSRHRPRRDR